MASAAKKVVVISDTHVHPWSAFAVGNGLENSRLQHTLRVIRESLLYARKHDLPWLFAGDLVHTAGYSLNVVMSAVTETLGEFEDVIKVAVWGNHDARGVGGVITMEQTVYPAIMRAVDNFWVLNNPVAIELPNGLTVSGAGYQPKLHLLTVGDEADIGIYHQTVANSITPHGFVMEEGIPHEWLLDRHRVSLVGHVHHPQEMEAPRGQAILVPGSPEHQNFGDVGDHGWWVLTIPARKDYNPKVEFHDGGSPRFLTVEKPGDVKADGNYYRVQSVSAGVNLPDGAIAIAPTPTVVEERDLLKDASSVEQILQVWLRANPPEEGIGKDQYLEVGRELLSMQEVVHLRDERVSRLHLHNFCSFEDATLQVEEGTWLVVGQGRDFPSNGAGKSTLVGEALYWLLFGHTTKGLGADEVIRWGARECEVEAVFAGESPLLVTRRKAKGVSELSVEEYTGDENHSVAWSASSVTEMTDKLCSFLGLTPEIYQSLGYFSQEKLILFSSATDGERKNVLADLIGMTAYQEASREATQRLSALNDSNARLDGRLEQLEEQAVSLKARRQQISEDAKAWQDDHIRQLEEAYYHYERAKEKRTILVATHGERAEQAKQHAERLAGWQIEQAKGQLETWTEERRRLHASELDGTLANLRSLRETQLEAAPSTQRDEIIEEIAKLEPAFEKLQANTALVAAVGAAGQNLHWAQQAIVQDNEATTKLQETMNAGTCPTCGQPIDEEHRARHLAEATERHNELLRILKAREHDYDQASRRAAAFSNLKEETRAKLVELRSALQEHDTYLHALQRIDDELAATQKERTALKKLAHAEAEAMLRERISHIEARREDRIASIDILFKVWTDEWTRVEEERRDQFETVEQQTNPHQAELALISEQITAGTSALKALQDGQRKLAIELAIHVYWQKGFSKQGIQSLLMDEVAAMFNQCRGSIFPALTQGVYDVQFSTTSLTRSGEIRERTEFQIFEHGQLVPYAALSGGQRRRIDIGVMLVMVKAVSTWMNVPGVLGILTLDEVFGFLDDSGAEGLVDALREVQEQIPTIYAVTHEPQLQSMFPGVLAVAQDAAGVSHLQEG